MTYKWLFKRATPGDKARESQVEKFFTSNAVKNRANGIVREGIQNSLDAAPDERPVHVRIKIGMCDVAETKRLNETYGAGLAVHLEAEGVSNKIHNLPVQGEALRYLAFEDFGTSGLKGDPGEWWPDEHGESGAFFNFFRAEGISAKSDGARGRHGVGRLVFMFASRTRSMFGLTVRLGDSGGAEQYLMGTTVLRNHRVGKEPYLPDGWFGQESAVEQGLTLPVEDTTYLASFKKDFGLMRECSPGLSIVVPWLELDVTYSSVLEAVLGEYYYPILSRKLSVEVVGEDDTVTKIGEESLESVIAAQTAEFQARVAPLVSLAKAALTEKKFIQLAQPSPGAPRWSKEVVSESIAEQIHSALDNDERIFLKVLLPVRPKGDAALDSEFLLCLERNREIGESIIQFIREGIIVSDVRPRRTSGVRAIVVIERGPLATFLGNAENPSHTEWQKDVVKDSYVYAVAHLDYVVQCVPMLLSLVSNYQSKPDTTLLLDLFSLPADDGKKREEDRAQKKDGTKSTPPNIDARRNPRAYRLSKTATGFSVTHGDEDAPRPSVLSIKAAYAVRRGNPFAKYDPADFDFDKSGISIETRGCKILAAAKNWISVLIEDDAFAVMVNGFDISIRDLRVDVQVKGEQSEIVIGVEDAETV